MTDVEKKEKLSSLEVSITSSAEALAVLAGFLGEAQSCDEEGFDNLKKTASTVAYMMELMSKDLSEKFDSAGWLTSP